MLVIDNISVIRGKKAALEEISLTLPAGKTMAVVGESGAGKSTLSQASWGCSPAAGINHLVGVWRAIMLPKPCNARASCSVQSCVGILRVLLAAPPLIQFDEPLSALDAVTQKHTAKLIADLQADEGFAALIVTHDLGYACAFADDIAVLRHGRVEEVGTAEAFFAAPTTEYGRTLRHAAFSLGALEAAE